MVHYKVVVIELDHASNIMNRTAQRCEGIDFALQPHLGGAAIPF